MWATETFILIHHCRLNPHAILRTQIEIILFEKSQDKMYDFSTRNEWHLADQNTTYCTHVVLYLTRALWRKWSANKRKMITFKKLWRFLCSTGRQGKSNSKLCMDTFGENFKKPASSGLDWMLYTLLYFQIGKSCKLFRVTFFVIMTSSPTICICYLDVQKDRNVHTFRNQRPKRFTLLGLRPLIAPKPERILNSN